LTDKSLAEGIKLAATKMNPPLDPNHYSTSSFKRGGISWMIMADIPQSVVNAASGHSEKGTSNKNYQSRRILPNAAAIIDNTKFSHLEATLSSAFRSKGKAPFGKKH